MSFQAPERNPINVPRPNSTGGLVPIFKDTTTGLISIKLPDGSVQALEGKTLFYSGEVKEVAGVENGTISNSTELSYDNMRVTDPA